MKKSLLILAFVLFMVGFIGCMTPAGDGEFATNGASFQRPEFIETRPAAEVEKVILKADPNYEKGKPTPTPDPEPTQGPDPNPNPAHKYAYIVGISDYDGTQNDLQYCDDDARDWNNYLRSQGFTVRMDLDGAATSTAIQAGLDWLAASAVPGDEIIFSYSGHGNNPSGYGSCIISSNLSYITHDFIAQRIQGANCTKKMVAIDACKAGDFLTVGGANAVSLVASQGTYSYDGTAAMNNGVWTYYFMESIGSGTVFSEIAAAYAETKMAAWAKTARVRVSPGHTDNYTGGFDM